MIWFFGKVMFFIFIYIWLRGTLPPLRYDQFIGSTGEIQWSPQHLDVGGVLWERSRSVRRRAGVGRRVVDGSGRRIGRYGRRCVRRDGLSRRVRCSVRSGV